MQKGLFSVEEFTHRDVLSPDDFFQDFLIASVRQFYSFVWGDSDEFEEAVEIPGAAEDVDDGEHEEERFIGVDEVQQTPDEW